MSFAGSCLYQTHKYKKSPYRLLGDTAFTVPQKNYKKIYNEIKYIIVNTRYCAAFQAK